ncbi:ABC transporter [Bdellovibrio bacteriovorus]|uniref:ABC transporter n=1 Tax=Bdellovibrio bacteriovorus TaxID=959 RepID=A0A162GJ92_BDEBC|nr:PilZ domain-containing protein [Bdellovibrio bacteriovorus]KYG68283.1 ABC transporter [Bdellovibrio bacteriovorus]
MKRKPWSLIVLALLHVFAPIGNLILNALRSGRTLPQQWTYWFEILPKPLLLLYVGVPILAGIFIYICRRWSYWAYLACIALVLLSNLYSYWTSMNWNTLVVLIAVLLVDVLIVAYFVVPSVQQVYFDPRMRWWEAAPRYNFNQEGTVNGAKAFIKNLSQGGLFLTAGPELAEGDKVDVYWKFDDHETVVSGLVVYRVNRPGSEGWGVRFEHTNESQRQVKRAIDKLHSDNKIVAERLPGPEDSFGAWLKKLVTKGEGLFPKFKS